MSTRLTLEIASNSLASALAAQAGGADRIELFDNLAEGGTTPSFASIAIARERLSIPLFVLVRPRPGDFHYDALETELMLLDLAQCRALRLDVHRAGARSHPPTCPRPPRLSHGGSPPSRGPRASASASRGS